MSLDCSIVRATPVGERIRVQLDDGSLRTIDHVFLGTGYKVDVSKYEFLDPKLAQSISRFQGFPRLSESFETSVPGLYFLGAPAIWSFGPRMQFVVGPHYASRALLRHIPTNPTAHRVQLSQPRVPDL